MNRIEIGKDFEIKAKRFLEEKGYEILEHSSSLNWSSYYDFLVKKGNKEFFVEVRGRSGKNQKYFVFSKDKIKRLRNLEKGVLIVLINSKGFLIFNLKDIPNHVKVSDTRNHKVYIVNSKSLLNLPMPNPVQSKQLRALKKMLDEMNVDEIIRGKVKPFGTSAYLNMPKKHISKNTIILILKD